MSPIYDELVELDGSARIARLHAISANDPDLARRLTSMLDTAQQVEAHRFLVPDRHFDAVASLGLRGRRLGPYELEEEIGHGGSGTVWRARRVDGQAGVVAIKVLHLSLLDQAGVCRFRREGAVLARLHHRNVVQLLDTGMTPQGQPYLVLEHVEGEPIDAHCDARRLDVHARLRLLRRVMDGLRHAHGLHIVHRDIKPGNILVTPAGEVKLLDFGIAKLLGDEPEHASLTIDGHRVLTPRYAAPEQLEGGEVTPRADVYALGVLMYRLLVGRYPTSGGGANAAEIIAGTLTGEPTPLARALSRPPRARESDAAMTAAERGTAVPDLKRQLRGGLDAIASRALRRDPADRYASVGAFARDIDSFLAGRRVQADYGLLPRELAWFVRAHKGAATVSVLMTLAVVAGLWGVFQVARWTRAADIALRQAGGFASTPLARPVDG